VHIFWIVAWISSFRCSVREEYTTTPPAPATGGMDECVHTVAWHHGRYILWNLHYIIYIYNIYYCSICMHYTLYSMMWKLNS
jgi:hypothetical protein